MQRSINEVEGVCLNMSLVYWAALVNMGSMLTGHMQTRQHLCLAALYHFDWTRSSDAARVPQHIYLIQRVVVALDHNEAIEKPTDVFFFNKEIRALFNIYFTTF